MNNYRIDLALILTLALTGCITEGDVQENPVSVDDAARANVRMGLTYLDAGRTDLARNKLLKAVELDPTLPEAHSALALMYQSAGERNKAASHYRQALKLDPDNGESQNFYGMFLCLNGEYKKGERYLLKAAGNQQYRTPWVAYTNAGTCARRADDLEGAEAYFRKALSYNARHSEALLKLASLSLDQGKFMSSRAFLQRYFDTVIRPGPDSLWLCVRVERELGDEQALADCSRKLRNLYPESKETQNLIAAQGTNDDGA